MRAAEASASLAGLYGSLASDDSDEDDEYYVRCYLCHHLYIRGQPMMMRLGDLVLLERILCCRSPPASRLLHEDAAAQELYRQLAAGTAPAGW